MKRILVLLLATTMVFSGCSDNGCKPARPEAEEPQITAYAAANGMNAVKHSSGLYYEIINPGSGPAPTLSSRVFVTYTGKRLDNTTFDQATSPVNFPLSGLIEGWKIGLPLIKKGGQIKLIVPSAMAYSCNGVPGTINANSVLFFDISLIDVQ